MSTDPTQPMSPPAPAGSRRPEQPEPESQEAAEDERVAPTRAEPVQATVPPTRVMPAQPTFQPAQPAQPSFQPAGGTAQPGPHADQGAREAAQGTPAPQQGGWPEQPSLYSPQPGWADSGRVPAPGGAGSGASGSGGFDSGGMAGAAGMGAPGGEAAPSGMRRLRRAGKSAYPGYPGGPAPRRRHRGRRWMMALFGLIVLLILLVIGDRVALAIAENDFADQAVKSGLPVKPSVTIEGFPFLTQLAARDFRRVDLSAANIPAGPVTITSVKATLNGMHLNSSFNGATVDHLNATVFVSFSALASAGGGPGGAGITMTAAGPDKVKITAGIGPLSDTEVAKVSQTGPNQISVQVLDTGSPLGGLLSSFGSFSFSLPKLPVPVHITGVSVTPQGLTLNATADHANLSRS